MELPVTFDDAKKGEPPGIKIGDAVSAYYKDKWRPGTLVEMGRKWAYVQLAGNDFKSKVPISAVRVLLGAQDAQPAAPPPEPQAADELTVVKDDSWWKIRRGARLVCILPGAYVEEKDAIFAALQRLDEGDDACKK